MSDRVSIVTGGNSGIGLQTCVGLATRGDTVYLCARSAAKGEAAVAEVKQASGNERVHLLSLDLASLASVRKAASTFLEANDRLDLLVNNAGLVLTDREQTEDGFEATFGINHLGHFLFTHLLLDALKAAAPSRVVSLSSAGHTGSMGLNFDDLMVERRTYNGVMVYCDSKLANLLFTKELARRLEGSGVVAHAVHPGVVKTGFAQDGDAKGWFYWGAKLIAPFMSSPAGGAKTSLHVAMSDDAGTTSGEYWARSRRKKPSKRARDEETAAKLWAVSLELVGLAAEPPSGTQT
jgi:retinol dehydrogenase 12